MQETNVKINNLNKQYDIVLLVSAVLKRLRSGSTSTFDQRLKSQKIQYFAQVFKVSPKYSFNLYIRGPYSSALANDLIELNKFNPNINSIKFVSDELEKRFKDLKDFVSEKTNRDLEITATLHWLLKIANLTNNSAEKKLKEWKGATSNEFRKALDLINKIPKYD